jgi:NitT/TauT family transport system ATP-binding protein
MPGRCRSRGPSALEVLALNGEPIPRTAASTSDPQAAELAAGAAIVFEQVRLSFGQETIYESLDFSVARGEFVCLLGPSGCGKSTSLRLIGDLLAPQSGTVVVGGRSPEAAWREVAFVFQSPRLAPWRNALDNVLLGVELRMGRAEARRREARARELLALVGLADAANKYPSMLSGGERQRVAIARALAVDPDIVLMDEPFSALDPNTRRRMRAEIERIWQQTGRTVLFVTHDIEEALVLADRIVLLSNKPTRVLESIEVPAARPRHPAADPILQALREQLTQRFQSLEPHGSPEDDT